MPLKIWRPSKELPPVVEQTSQATPAKIGYHAAVEFYRTQAAWNVIFDENGFNSAKEKLLQILKQDIKVPEGLFESISLSIPCLIDQKQARTRVEEEAIRRAHRRFSKIFAGLVDRIIHYRPESMFYALEWAKQEFISSAPLWKPFQCETFGREEEPKRRRKSKSSGQIQS